MKKLTAWMLAALMVLSMAGCGKQAESTEVSSAEKSETAATTAAVTTEAETPARTVEPTTEAVKDLSAEEAWKALLGHIADFAEAMADKEKGDAVSLSLSGKLALGVTLSMDNDGEPFEMPIALEGSGKAKFNSKQAAEADLTYKADFGQLGAMLGLGGEDADEMHTLKYYADFEGERSYSCTDEGDWYWDELNLMVNPENLDREQLDEITLDKLFSDYSFDSDKNSYNFSGTLDLEALGESASSLTDAYGLSADMLAPRAELQLDKDCHLRSLRIFIEPFTIELSEGVMEGLTVDLEKADLQLEFTYDEVSVEIPAEVKETAVERPEDGNDDNKIPNANISAINIETGKVNVLYKLKDNKNFGLLEPEA